ncbi:hypothetical protein AURDEDRAFT_185676 [Auricularia subglabra TFB-10046 SS5]|nr:hypothetical protein AURDEDRAFT_185676 [Auricularia subglabra TFB-10046 SS5]
MAASTVIVTYPLSPPVDRDSKTTYPRSMYVPDIDLSRSTSGSGSSDSEAPSLMASESQMSSTSASSAELDSPSDSEADCNIDGVSTGIPSPFLLSPRRLDTPCTPMLLRECGGRFPFPIMDQQDAGYDSDSDKKISKRSAARPAAVRPRLRRAGSALLHPRHLQSTQGGERHRSRSLLAPVSPQSDIPEAAAPAAVTPPLPLPPSPTLLRANRPTKIDLPPPPALPKADARAALGRGLPSRLANSGRRAASSPVPTAPRLCATPVDARSPSPLDLPSPLCIAHHPSSPAPQRGRSLTIAGLLSSVNSASPRLPSSPSAVPPRLKRLITDKRPASAAPPPTPCTPRRMMQQHRSLLAPRDTPPRLSTWRKPDTPVEKLTNASECNPYFDSAIIIPGVGAMLAPAASSSDRF